MCSRSRFLLNVLLMLNEMNLTPCHDLQRVAQTNKFSTKTLQCYTYLYLFISTCISIPRYELKWVAVILELYDCFEKRESTINCWSEEPQPMARVHLHPSRNSCLSWTAARFSDGIIGLLLTRKWCIKGNESSSWASFAGVCQLTREGLLTWAVN